MTSIAPFNEPYQMRLSSKHLFQFSPLNLEKRIGFSFKHGRISKYFDAHLLKLGLDCDHANRLRHGEESWRRGRKKKVGKYKSTKSGRFYDLCPFLMATMCRVAVTGYLRGTSAGYIARLSALPFLCRRLLVICFFFSLSRAVRAEAAPASSVSSVSCGPLKDRVVCSGTCWSNIAMFDPVLRVNEQRKI